MRKRRPVSLAAVSLAATGLLLWFMNTGAVGSTPEISSSRYDLDPAHTSIVFQASHFGFSSPFGRLGIKSGHVILDEASPKNSTVEVVIDVNSLSTGVKDLDKHLKAEDFLHAVAHPEATFKSNRVILTGKETARVTGDLTLRGISKGVTLDVRLNKLDKSPITQKRTAGFSATGELKRTDFGITQYAPGVSDEVTLRIEAEAIVAPVSQDVAATKDTAE